MDEFPLESQGVQFEMWKRCVLHNWERRKSTLSSFLQSQLYKVDQGENTSPQKRAFLLLSKVYQDEKNRQFQKVADQYGPGHCRVLSLWYARLAD